MLHEDAGAIGIQSDVISATNPLFGGVSSGHSKDDDSHDDITDPKVFIWKSTLI